MDIENFAFELRPDGKFHFFLKDGSGSHYTIQPGTHPGVIMVDFIPLYNDNLLLPPSSKGSRWGSEAVENAFEISSPAIYLDRETLEFIGYPPYCYNKADEHYTERYSDSLCPESLRAIEKQNAISESSVGKKNYCTEKRAVKGVIAAP